jgi:hypothetical protein
VKRFFRELYEFRAQVLVTVLVTSVVWAVLIYENVLPRPYDPWALVSEEPPNDLVDAAQPVSATAPPQPSAPLPTCPLAIASGYLLDVKMTSSGPHHLKIENGAMGNAIIKVRDAITGHLFVSFFVASGEITSFDHLPDGVYRIQWVIGDKLAQDCSSFARANMVDEFDGTESLRASATVEYQTLSYTLYAVPGGNARSHAISLAEFNAE